MATIGFYAGEGFAVNDIANSGLGFYGNSFGASVRIGQYQDTTFCTDSTGTVQGFKTDNIKYTAPNSGELAGGDQRPLREIPNYLSTLEVRFTHTSPVQVQNATATIFDRNNINNPPSGVTIKMCEIIHPWTTQTPAGSGSLSWKTPGGSGGLINGYTYDPPMALADSPGTSGLSPSGASTVDTTHSWFLGMSASPNVVGSRSAALLVQLEYI